MFDGDSLAVDVNVERLEGPLFQNIFKAAKFHDK